MNKYQLPKRFPKYWSLLVLTLSCLQGSHPVQSLSPQCHHCSLDQMNYPLQRMQWVGREVGGSKERSCAHWEMSHALATQLGSPDSEPDKLMLVKLSSRWPFPSQDLSRSFCHAWWIQRALYFGTVSAFKGRWQRRVHVTWRDHDISQASGKTELGQQTT